MSIAYMANYMAHAPYPDPSMILAMIVLGNAANDDGILWHSVPKLAAQSRLSVRRFREIVAILEADGLLQREPRLGRSNLWRLRLYDAAPPATHRRGDAYPCDPPQGGLRPTAGGAATHRRGGAATGRTHNHLYEPSITINEPAALDTQETDHGHARAVPHIWQVACEQIRKELTAGQYSSWILPQSLWMRDDGTFEIHVRSSFAAELLSAQLHGAIDEGLRHAAGRPVDWEVVWQELGAIREETTA